ncbi:hypothetical protein BMS3Abin10_01746 [bacterium BMS3Abin10]|nr:hypothetical protein BMS3Abin10_01746 [bacterium BMS3Abin10]GBE39109.1 hypothetical protein BMS3Bbin08_01727 [bacterium BMS3Bbin08]
MIDVSQAESQKNSSVALRIKLYEMTILDFLDLNVYK